MTYRNAILIGFLLRFIVSIWNGFYGPSFGAELDAQTFHMVASQMSQDLTYLDQENGSYYSYFLGWVYFLTTNSLFLGSMLSTIAWTLSAVIIAKLGELLLLSKDNLTKALLIFALLPSSIMLTSVTLRESYQLLFLSGAIYCCVQIFMNRSMIYWPIFIFNCIAMASMHGGLLAVGMIMFILLIIFSSVRDAKEIPIVKIIFATLILILIIPVFIGVFGESGYNTENGLVDAIDTYQTKGANADAYARAVYKTSAPDGGSISLLTLLPLSFLQYMFEPMPWRISALIDINCFAENILRGWLIWQAFCCIRKSDGLKKKTLILIFTSYLITELIWSLGTVNWGTAIRHHIPSIGLLVLVAFAQQNEFSKKDRNKYS